MGKGTACLLGGQTKSWRRRLVGWVAVLLFAGGGASAADVVILRSASISAYDEVVGALLDTVRAASLAEGPKSITRKVISDWVLPGPAGAEATITEVRAAKPQLIVAVGSAALKVAREVSDSPIVYLLAPDAAALSRGVSNVTGVTMDLPPSLVFQALPVALPKVRRLGVVYDPRRSDKLLREAADAAKAAGLTLVARQAHSASEVPGLVTSLRSSIDAFWLIPDLTVVTPETLDHLALFSLESRVPVVAFSEKYLKLGATVAVTFDLSALGQQAGEMVNRILAGAPAGSIPQAAPAKIRVRFNQAVASRLGLVPASGLPRGPP